MFRKIKKVFCCSMILSLVVSSLAFSLHRRLIIMERITHTQNQKLLRKWKQKEMVIQQVLPLQILQKASVIILLMLIDGMLTAIV